MFRINSAKLSYRIIKTTRSLSTISSTIIGNRHKYASPSLSTFEAYDKPLILKKGDKQYLWDIDDNKYIDLLGQNLCVSVGYNHPKIIGAATEQIKKLAHCTTMYYNEKPSTLYKQLVEKMPPHPSGEDWVVHLVNDGSEAVDLAIQMARVYTGRPEIITQYKAYHGLHGYAAGLTSIGKSTQPSYASMFTGISCLEPNNIDLLENHIKFATGGKLGGFIIEPLQGFGGIFPLKKGYMKNAFDLVNKHGGVTIADEVQTGYGRCGESFWGFEMANNSAIPDMVTIAKGMGNGVGIIGGVICRRSIAEAFADKMFFNTYASNPVACSIASSVLEVIEEDNIISNCNKQGLRFNEKLSILCDKYPSVYKENRGKGLFQGLEIYGKTVEDSLKNAVELHKRMLSYGVIIGRGSAAGNVFRIQPPMCIEEKDVDYIVESLEDNAIKFLKN
jgi:alanine-glyoxylate transaminase / (R)-3-amino-2-methylpropionate-pyruvate transaminase